MMSIIMIINNNNNNFINTDNKDYASQEKSN